MKINVMNKSFVVSPTDTLDWSGGSTEYWNIVNNQGWEMQTFETMNKFLDKEHSYVDIGAWVGPTVLFGAQLSKTCYAVEPDPVAFSKLKENVELNPDIDNIKLFEMAISPETGQVRMGTFGCKGDSMSTLVYPLPNSTSNETWMVEGISIKDFFENNKINDCNLIKIDIEGGEFHLLSSNRQFFKDVGAKLYLSIHCPWFHPNQNQYYEGINEVLSLYKYIYNHENKIVTLKELSEINGFYSILATN